MLQQPRLLELWDLLLIEFCKLPRMLTLAQRPDREVPQISPHILDFL